MKKKNLLMLLLAFALVLSASIGTAWAYFTTYARAQGGYTIHLGSRTEIHEKVAQWTKHVTISSKEKSQPVYVRAKGFSGSKYPLTYSGSDWKDGGDGYWYYTKALYAGEETGSLDIKINDVPEAEKDSADVNVIVIYETTPVAFDKDGKEVGWQSADWNAKLDQGTWKEGAQG